MATQTTSAGLGGVLPEQYGPLVVQPVIAASVFAQVANVAQTSANEYHIPIVSADPTASWGRRGPGDLA